MYHLIYKFKIIISYFLDTGNIQFPCNIYLFECTVYFIVMVIFQQKRKYNYI